MANLRDVRTRIRGVSQTLQVTRAMNLISTAKLRKARRVLEDALPFFDRIREAMNEIVEDAGRVDSEYFNLRSGNERRRTAVIVVTSDRGLAGGYNANMARFAENLCASFAGAFIIVVGSVGQRYFVNSRHPVIENFSYRSKLPEVSDARQIADFVVSQFLWEVFDEVHIAYTRMHSAVRLVPESVCFRWIPPILEGSRASWKRCKKSVSDSSTCLRRKACSGPLHPCT